MKSHESRRCDGFLRSTRCVVERENSLLCTNTGRVFTFFSILLRTDLFRPFSNVYRRQTCNSFFPSQVVSALFRSRGSTFSLLSRATSFPVLLVERDEANRSQLRVNSTLLPRYYPSFGIFAHGCESNYIHRNIRIPSTFLLFLFLSFFSFFFLFFAKVVSKSQILSPYSPSVFCSVLSNVERVVIILVRTNFDNVPASVSIEIRKKKEQTVSLHFRTHGGSNASFDSPRLG